MLIAASGWRRGGCAPTKFTANTSPQRLVNNTVCQCAYLYLAWRQTDSASDLLEMAKNDDFFESQRSASLVKTRIVVEYFKPWARIMANQVRNNNKPRLAYVDLYSGPGKYEDGTSSTPLQILEHAIITPDLCEMLVTLFNDSDQEHADALVKNIRALPGIEKLRTKPQIRLGEVDDDLVAMFKKLNLVPTFSFIDPFGYKGLTLELVDALLRSFGCDMVLFFSFNSINRSLTNKFVKKHIDALFGPKKAEELREACKEVHAEKREELLIEKFIEALNSLGYEYVIPYVVERDDKDRTSHYLIFISKNKRGFQIMKDVMYALSEHRTQGVARFGHVRDVSKKRTPLLALFNTPLDDFAEELCEEFAGTKMSRKEMRESYDLWHPRNPFVDRNWRDALSKLEGKGRIKCKPSKEERPIRKGTITFGPNTVVTFPKEKK